MELASLQIVFVLNRWLMSIMAKSYLTVIKGPIVTVHKTVLGEVEKDNKF